MQLNAGNADVNGIGQLICREEFILIQIIVIEEVRYLMGNFD